MVRERRCEGCEWWVAKRLTTADGVAEMDEGTCHLMPEVQTKWRDSFCSAWERRGDVEELLGPMDVGVRSDVESKGQAAVESLADPDDGTPG